MYSETHSLLKRYTKSTVSSSPKKKKNLFCPLVINPSPIPVPGIYKSAVYPNSASSRMSYRSYSMELC